jgi:hypothetical protein
MPQNIHAALGILIDAYSDDLIAADLGNEQLCARFNSAFARVHHWWLETQRELLEQEELWRMALTTEGIPNDKGV